MSEIQNKSICFYLLSSLHEKRPLVLNVSIFGEATAGIALTDFFDQKRDAPEVPLLMEGLGVAKENL